MRPCAIASRLTRACTFRAGSNGRLLARSLDQLERPKEPAAANVADERVLGEALVQATLEPRAHLDHIGEQPIPLG